jgi:hypothetical protein
MIRHVRDTGFPSSANSAFKALKVLERAVTK